MLHIGKRKEADMQGGEDLIIMKICGKHEYIMECYNEEWISLVIVFIFFIVFIDLLEYFYGRNPYQTELFERRGKLRIDAKHSCSVDI